MAGCDANLHLNSVMIESRSPFINNKTRRSNNGFDRERGACVVSLLLFRLSLDAAVLFAVAPVFYNHFLFPIRIDFHPMHYIVSLVVYMLSFFVVIGNKKNVVDLMNIIAIIFCFAPLTSVYGLDSYRDLPPVIGTLGAIFVSNYIARVPARPIFPAFFKHDNPMFPVYFSAAMVGLFLLWTVVSGAIALINIDFARIYEFRRVASSVLDVGLMGYINIWVTKVFNIYLLCIAIRNRSIAFVTLLLIFQFYFFSITSHRELIFLPLLTLAMLVFYRSNWNFSGLIMFASSLVLFSVIVTTWLGFDEVGSLVLRRAFFVPASATYEWFGYFKDASFVLWTDKLFGIVGFTEYSGLSLPFVIGDHLAYDRDVGANNGFVSSGYAHAGFIGILVYSLIVGLIIKMLADLPKAGIPIWMIAAVMINPIRTAWVSSDLLTAIVSHGILIGVALLIYSRDQTRRASA